MRILEDSDTTKNSYDNILEILNYTSIALSLFSAFIIVFIFFCFRSLRKFPFNLIFYMTLSCFIDDCLYIICDLIKISELSQISCIITGFIIGLLGLLTAGYGTIIAITIVSKTLSYSIDLEANEKYLHIINISLSTIFSLIPFVNDSYGSDEQDNTCWIFNKDEKMSFIMQIISYYSLLWFQMIIVLIAFVRLVFFYRKYMNDIEVKEFMNDQYITAKRLLAYPIIFIFILTLKTVYKIYYFMLNPEHSTFFFYFTLFVMIFGNSQGTMSVLVFGSTGIIIEKIKGKLRKLCRNSYDQTGLGEDDLQEDFQTNLNNNKYEKEEEEWENIDKNKIEEEIKNSLN